MEQKKTNEQKTIDELKSIIRKQFDKSFKWVGPKKKKATHDFLSIVISTLWDSSKLNRQ